MKIVFSDRAYTSIMSETVEKIKTETGGLFLGTFMEDTWYVVEAIDPGPKSIFQVAYFEYDQTYTQHLINKIANLYNSRLDLIGLWHRHPGSFDQFSSTDDSTNLKYARMRKEGAISGLVNIDPLFRLSMFHVDHKCHYSKISFEVGDALIPDELKTYKSIRRFEDYIGKSMNSGKEKAGQQDDKSLKSFISKIISNNDSLYCDENISFEEQDVDDIFDEIIDDITYMIEIYGLSLVLTKSKNSLCVTDKNSKEKIYFKKVQNTKNIVFEFEKKVFKYQRGLFQKVFEESSVILEKKETPSKTTLISKAVGRLNHFFGNEDEKQ